MIKNTVKFVLGIGIAALTVAGLSGCSVSVDGEDYRSVSPVFDIEQFFDDGETKDLLLVTSQPKGQCSVSQKQ